MKYFNDLNEAYERSMMARGEPEKEKTLPTRNKPEGSEIYDWDQFVEWAESEGVDIDSDLSEWEKFWDCWKEGYVAGVESTVEDE